MTRIPRAALAVGWLGLIPFLAAALLILAPDTFPVPAALAPGRATGVLILERFGAAILGFMGGCLWGFASAEGRRPALALLAATALPALVAALAIRPNPALSCIWLAFGFVLVQGIDILFHRAGVAPAWWLSLRLPLTAGVIACLLIGALYG